MLYVSKPGEPFPQAEESQTLQPFFTREGPQPGKKPRCNDCHAAAGSRATKRRACQCKRGREGPRGGGRGRRGRERPGLDAACSGKRSRSRLRWSWAGRAPFQNCLLPAAAGQRPAPGSGEPQRKASRRRRRRRQQQQPPGTVRSSPRRAREPCPGAARPSRGSGDPPPRRPPAGDAAPAPPRPAGRLQPVRPSIKQSILVCRFPTRSSQSG